MENKNVRPEWVPSGYNDLKNEEVNGAKTDKENTGKDIPADKVESDKNVKDGQADNGLKNKST